MIRRLRILAIVVLALGMAGLRMDPAHAAPLPTALLVTDCTNDSGTGTLRAAVGQANSDNAGDGIYFNCSGTITLASTLDITGTMTIDGGSNSITIDGNNAVQLFHVASGVTLDLKHLDLEDGKAYEGGAIDNLGTVGIDDCYLQNNSATGGGSAEGGAVMNWGTLTIDGSYLSGNSADLGGAIENATLNSTASISNTSFPENDASVEGGAIDNIGTVSVDGGGFSDNVSPDGGAIYDQDGSVAIDGASLSGNNASYGGAIYNGPVGDVDITDSTVSQNYSSGYGGAIYTTYWSGDVSIDSSAVSNNGALYGGAIAATDQATVEIFSSTVSDNYTTASSGGAIWNSTGAVKIEQSTLSENSAFAGGGAIYNHQGTANVTQSLLSANSAAHGGAIYNDDGTVNIATSTLWENSASNGTGPSTGGAIDNLGAVTIVASTLYGNGAAPNGVGGAIDNDGGGMGIGATILANNSAASGGNCSNSGTLNDNAYNLTDSNGNCGLNDGKTDLVNTDPKLDSLADNGGPTQTIALQSGSPAIDKIPAVSTDCSSYTTDQRGYPYSRPDNGEGACDIGAYESTYPDLTTLTVKAASGPYNGTAMLTATLTSGSWPVSGRTITFALNGTAVCGGTGQPACPSTDSSGVATLNSASLAGIATGTYPSSGACSSLAGVYASFAGDTGDASSNGCNTLTVTTVSTTTSLTSSVNPTATNHPVTYTAAVSPVPDGGTVAFTDGSSTITGCGAQAVNTTSGKATCTVTYANNAAGAHSIVAAYSGHGGYLTSTSAPLVEQVDTDLSGYPTLPGGAENLGNTNLSGGYFWGVNLSGASLSNSNFTSANFTNATLTGANLSNSNFKYAIFKGADLTNANMSGSNFASADFTNAKLTGAHLLPTQLMGAIWSNTTCPDGTNSTNDGGTCAGHL